MAIKPVYISRTAKLLKRRARTMELAKLLQYPSRKQKQEAQTVGDTTMTETNVQTNIDPAPAEEPKLTIAQKVSALQTEKTEAVSKMNAMQEGPEKTAVQERIAVIDRKLNWYAGRSGATKGAAKAVRPTKAAKVKADKPAKQEAKASADTPVDPDANAS